MSDSYLAIDAIANNDSMIGRMKAAVVQQWKLGNLNLGNSGNNEFNVETVVDQNHYSWAASPGWGAAWESAEAGGNQDPGKDPAVITDQMILSTVQELFGVTATEG